MKTSPLQAKKYIPTYIYCAFFKKIFFINYASNFRICSTLPKSCLSNRKDSESEPKVVSSRNNSESEPTSPTRNGKKNKNKVVPARKLSKMMAKGTIVFQDVGGVYMLIHKPTGQWVMKNGEYLEFVTPRKTSNSKD